MGDVRKWGELPQGEFVLHLSSIPDAAALNQGMKLVTADEKKTVVAELHRAHHFKNKQKARLEVHQAGMDILDYIIVVLSRS